MNWRHIVLAFLIEIAREAMHPLGGVFFPPVRMPGWDPVVNFLVGSWMVSNLTAVYCVLVADEAFDEGVSPLKCYGSVAAALVVVWPFMDRLYYSIVPFEDRQRFAGFDEGGAQMLWWALVMLYESGFGLSIYAYWRVTQRATQRTQAAETERALDEQRVQTARLLALQSRVDPQLLFDALRRVGDLHRSDPEAADGLLRDLIALLRSIQPSAGLDNSTIEREFGLVEAWLRVMRSVGHQPSQVRLQMAPASTGVCVAPMLLLPLTRAVLAVPHDEERMWQMSARVAEGRLLVALETHADDDGAPAILRGADFAALSDRLGWLFGPSARLAISDRPPSVTLDLPRLLEDIDDACSDR